MKSPKAKALDLRISRSAQKKRQDQGHFIRYTKEKARRYRAFCNCGNSPSARAAAPEQVDDRQQDDSTDQRGDQEADPAPEAQPPHRQQPAAEAAADDADDNVEDDALLPIGAPEHARKPAADAADDQHDDEVHATDSLSAFRTPCRGPGTIPHRA